MKKWLIGLLVVLPLTMVHAEDKSSGCGLGWMVTQKHSLFASTIRSTTNALFGNQTFGMTSGTSGCAKHSIVKNEKQLIHYTEANLANLEIEMAIGEGEFLQAFGRSLGCQDAVLGKFGQMTKNSYGRIFGKNSEAQKVISNVRGVLKEDATLAQACGQA